MIALVVRLGYEIAFSRLSAPVMTACPAACFPRASSRHPRTDWLPSAPYARGLLRPSSPTAESGNFPGRARDHRAQEALACSPNEASMTLRDVAVDR
jgi:hypothetical protein